jgi:hypothetical protein
MEVRAIMLSAVPAQEDTSWLSTPKDIRTTENQRCSMSPLMDSHAATKGKMWTSKAAFRAFRQHSAITLRDILVARIEGTGNGCSRSSRLHLHLYRRLDICTSQSNCTKVVPDETMDQSLLKGRFATQVLVDRRRWATSLAESIASRRSFMYEIVPKIIHADGNLGDDRARKE